jgi:hypothetical protein
MRIGMLWFDDNTQRDLVTKIDRAVRHYEAKYGTYPTICYVHPSMLVKRSAVNIGLEIRASNMILPNHFWLGAGDAKPMEKRSAA